MDKIACKYSVGGHIKFRQKLGRRHWPPRCPRVSDCSAWYALHFCQFWWKYDKVQYPYAEKPHYKVIYVRQDTINAISQFNCSKNVAYAISQFNYLFYRQKVIVKDVSENSTENSIDCLTHLGSNKATPGTYSMSDPVNNEWLKNNIKLINCKTLVGCESLVWAVWCRRGASSYGARFSLVGHVTLKELYLWPYPVSFLNSTKLLQWSSNYFQYSIALCYDFSVNGCNRLSIVRSTSGKLRSATVLYYGWSSDCCEEENKDALCSSLQWTTWVPRVQLWRRNWRLQSL